MERERLVDCDRKRTPNGAAVLDCPPHNGSAVLEYGNDLPSSVCLNKSGRLIAGIGYPEPVAKPRGFVSNQKPVVSINSISIRKRWLSIRTTFASASFILNGYPRSKPEW
jgi:hypothetical protein